MKTCLKHVFEYCLSDFHLILAVTGLRRPPQRKPTMEHTRSPDAVIPAPQLSLALASLFMRTLSGDAIGNRVGAGVAPGGEPARSLARAGLTGSAAGTMTSPAALTSSLQRLSTLSLLAATVAAVVATATTLLTQSPLAPLHEPAAPVSASLACPCT